MKKNYFLLFLLGFLFLLTDVYAQSIRYVKQGGTGDGSTWSNASGDLQEMINASSDNDQVWVAAGAYKPNRRPDNIEAIAPANDRFNSFLLKTNVSVYGGFAGTEDEILDRDIAANETILSGNIGDENTNEDNTYHVVTIVGYMGPKTVFDGFIVEDGYTEAISGSANTIRVNDQNVPSTRSPGIIMYFVDHMELRNLIIRNNTNASPGQNAGALYMFSGAGGNLRNIQFINNKTTNGYGGAMYTYGTSNIPAVINFYNVSFVDNVAREGYAGGVFIGQYSNLKFYDCNFERNKATRLCTPNTNGECVYTLGDGGAVYLGSSTSNADFYNTNFTENESEARGGVIRAPNSGRLNISGGIFKNNRSTVSNAGGAISATASGLIINIKGSTFDGNSTTASGGGAIYMGTGTYTIEDSKFINNTASSVGGGIYFEPNTISISKVINCDFESNTSGTTGGAIYSTGADLEIISSRFIKNVSTTSGGALYLLGAGKKAAIVNSLFVENESRGTGSGGGAIYLGASFIIDMYNSTLVGNKLINNTLGGAFYLSGGSTLNLYNSLSYSNRASSATTTLTRHDLYVVTSGANISTRNTLTEYYGIDGVDGNIVGQAPLFLSTTLGDANFLEVSDASPIIDKGVIADVPIQLEFDALGRSRIYNGKIDIGAVEHKGAKSEPTVFHINENLEDGKKLGDNNIVNTVPTVISNVPNHSLQGNIKWRIISGNETGAFAINETSGEISVANATLLNYEVTKQFTLTVRIEDDFAIALGGPNYQQITVVININNLEEIPEKPIVENVVHGDVVTTYRPRLRGIAEPSSIITIYVDGKLYINPKTGFAETVTADETGAWRFRFPEELVPGYREFSVTSKPRISASETAQSEAARVNLKLYGGGTAGLKPTNILTPNGDGKNDVWTIENLSVMYPGDLQNIGEQGTPRHHEIIVYDKVGKIVFRWSSKERGRSYDSDNKNGEAWDGTYNGNPLPAGTYYYNINIGAGLDRIKGTITIIRGR